jgi:hypothetical protein
MSFQQASLITDALWQCQMKGPSAGTSRALIHPTPSAPDRMSKDGTGDAQCRKASTSRQPSLTLSESVPNLWQGISLRGELFVIESTQEMAQHRDTLWVDTVSDSPLIGDNQLRARRERIAKVFNMPWLNPIIGSFVKRRYYLYPRYFRIVGSIPIIDQKHMYY